MDEVWNRDDVKIMFTVFESEYDRLHKKLNLGKYDFLCLTIDYVHRYSNSSKVYIEASILSDLKVEVPESAD